MNNTPVKSTCNIAVRDHPCSVLRFQTLGIQLYGPLSLKREMLCCWCQIFCQRTFLISPLLPQRIQLDISSERKIVKTLRDTSLCYTTNNGRRQRRDYTAPESLRDNHAGRGYRQVCGRPLDPTPGGSFFIHHVGRARGQSHAPNLENTLR